MILREQEVSDGEAVQPTCKKTASLEGDRANVYLLIFLYLLQGVVLGLGESVPMVLQSKGVSYNDQAIFSITAWPYSVKLLWAPIVDAVYSSRFGRRKSWLVPAQYIIGITMLCLSYRANAWIDDPAGPRIVLLTVFFFLLTFLAATQDVALDGWAITMLKRENIGYAATCGSVGQTIGISVGFFVFMSLESADFCNAYLRSEPQPYGIITLSSFLNYFGWIFLTTTTLVMLFKSEETLFTDEEHSLGVLDTYKKLIRIIRLPAIKTFSIFLLTMSISFSACDAISWLKLVRLGLDREKFALATTVIIPVKVSLLLFFRKRMTGEKSMGVFMKIYPVRLAFNLVASVFIWSTPQMLMGLDVPLYFYGLLILIYGCIQMAYYFMAATRLAFYARTSDPALGGTYMTLMNTLSNLGMAWPNSLVLLLVDPLTFSQCSTDAENTCSNSKWAKECAGECETYVDGYYVLIAICTVFGLLWLRWAIPTIRELQSKDPQEWKVSSGSQKKFEKSQFLK
ncbi:acetyl-coenzyme A transporter 1-like [Homalodisca vitripennis]|uniref:acetyl-coenzyme A transporter 1-like n=1 Tax=Homalodisca vitripennis TaxID=197043 RepID=UPI001EE9D392|nr:acetyl-coenzyme A transporter 1-like [Homalodisca vitripennis]